VHEMHCQISSFVADVSEVPDPNVALKCDHHTNQVMSTLSAVILDVAWTCTRAMSDRTPSSWSIANNMITAGFYIAGV
jgi:hypothetical protein